MRRGLLVVLVLASRLAIEPGSAAERGYLALLAARLGLDDALVAGIEREVASQPTPLAGRGGERAE